MERLRGERRKGEGSEEGDKDVDGEGAPLLASSKPSKLLLFCFFFSFSDKIWYGYFKVFTSDQFGFFYLFNW